MSRLLLNRRGVIIQRNSKGVVLSPFTNAPVMMSAQSTASGTLRNLHHAASTNNTTTLPFTTNVTTTTTITRTNCSRRSFASCSSRVGTMSSLATTDLNSPTSCGFSNDIAVAKIGSIRKMSAGSSEKFLQLENINPNFIVMEYAVRGPLVVRAGQIEKELQQVGNFSIQFLFLPNNFWVNMFKLFNIYSLRK